MHLVFTDDLERQKKSNSQIIDIGWKEKLVTDTTDCPKPGDIPTKALIHFMEMRQAQEPFTQPFMCGKGFHT